MTDFDGKRWRPYANHAGGRTNLHGLPCKVRVAAHSLLLIGKSITVCLNNAKDNVFVSALETAAGAWNQALEKGLGYPPFKVNATDPYCNETIPIRDIDYVQVTDDRQCNVTMAPCGSVTNMAPAVAYTYNSLNPPRVRWTVVRVNFAEGKDDVEIGDELERLLRHELGHHLGLADYRYGCWRLEDSGEMSSSR